VVVTKNGRSAALPIPIDEDTGLETLILSNSSFWQLFDRAAAGKRTPLEAVPDPGTPTAASVPSRNLP
jgi:hypothetical protein